MSTAKIVYACCQLLVLIGVCIDATYANSPRLSAVYTQYSENGQYYYKTIPYTRHPYNRLGRTIVYKAGGETPLYELDQYVDRYGYLSDDGSAIAIINNIAANHSFYQKDTIGPVRIFRYGKQERALTLEALIRHNWLVQLENSRTLAQHWLLRSFVHKDTLYLFNAINEVVAVNLTIDAPEKKYSVTEVKKRFERALPTCRQEYQDIRFKCPIYWCTPKLIDGIEIHAALKKYLSDEAAKMGVRDSIYNTSYSILVNRSGRCRLYSFDPDNKKLQLLTPKIAKWIASANVATDRMPEQVDQWLFQGYLAYTWYQEE